MENSIENSMENSISETPYCKCSEKSLAPTIIFPIHLNATLFDSYSSRAFDSQSSRLLLLLRRRRRQQQQSCLGWPAHWWPKSSAKRAASLVYSVLSGPAGSLQGESPRPAALARPRRSDEEVCRPPSPIRLGWPDRAYGTAPPAPLVQLNRHGEACLHAGPTRLACKPGGPSPPEGSR
jgi:hypothetical protein